MILESKIAPTTAYQKQQETLICWSENDQELALSFQLIDSCSEIWEKICDVSILYDFLVNIMIFLTMTFVEIPLSYIMEIV